MKNKIKILFGQDEIEIRMKKVLLSGRVLECPEPLGGCVSVGPRAKFRLLSHVLA